MREYILYHRNGGWFTKTSQLHSDFKQAQVFDYADALDMIQLHSGKLFPVDKDMYEAAMKGVKS